MSLSSKVFQRLLRSPKPLRKSDLLSDREYHQLSSTSFEDYHRINFNSEQLQKLSVAEVAQLEAHYQQLEKKSERTQKRIRDKRHRDVPPPVVIRYVPAPTAAEQEVPEIAFLPEPEIAPEDDNDLRQVLDNIEKRIVDESPEQQQASGRLTDEIERALDELNVSLNMIDLSQAMPPKELLLEEPPVQEPVVQEIFDELDLGPPGDAGAFLGVESPMPLSDGEVRSRLLQEFPSLRRPEVGGRFEDLEEVPMPEMELMPPPAGIGISSSTPIAAIPTTAVRGFPYRLGMLYNTDLSAIKGPTPAGVLTARRGEDTPDQMGEAHEVVSAVPSDVPMHDMPSDVPMQETPQLSEPAAQAQEPMQTTASEPVQAREQVQSELQDVVTSAPAPASTDSSSSVERPVERPRRASKSCRKVPVYGESSVTVPMKLRTHFDFDYDDDLDSFEQTRALIQWIIDPQTDRVVPAPRPSIPVDIEGQPVLRDISTTQAELSSIREIPLNQSRLYPIHERPQQEEREEQQLQSVSLPVPVAEEANPPIVVPVAPPSLNLPEVSLGDANRALDTGLGNQSLFQDTSTSFSIPQVVITDTSIDTDSRLQREKTGSEKPTNERTTGNDKEASVQPVVAPGDRSRASQPVEQPGEAVEITVNDEALTSIINLYLTLQREVVRSKRSLVPMDRLAQITSVGRVACAKRFLQLMTLKMWGFIEIGADEKCHVQSISLRPF